MNIRICMIKHPQEKYKTNDQGTVKIYNVYRRGSNNELKWEWNTIKDYLSQELK